MPTDMYQDLYGHEKKFSNEIDKQMVSKPLQPPPVHTSVGVNVALVR